MVIIEYLNNTPVSGKSWVDSRIQLSADVLYKIWPNVKRNQKAIWRRQLLDKLCTSWFFIHGDRVTDINHLRGEEQGRDLRPGITSKGQHPVTYLLQVGPSLRSFQNLSKYCHQISVQRRSLQGHFRFSPQWNATLCFCFCCFPVFFNRHSYWGRKGG